MSEINWIQSMKNCRKCSNGVIHTEINGERVAKLCDCGPRTLAELEEYQKQETVFCPSCGAGMSPFPEKHMESHGTPERVIEMYRRNGWRVDCPECGGNCAPECGRHPAGCVYGGFSHGYWIIAEGCTLEHITPPS